MNLHPIHPIVDQTMALIHPVQTCAVTAQLNHRHTAVNYYADFCARNFVQYVPSFRTEQYFARCLQGLVMPMALGVTIPFCRGTQFLGKEGCLASHLHQGVNSLTT